MPPRWRSRLISNAGKPGALAASGSDGAERTCHRLDAALGIGVASPRTSKAKAPASAAASASRRDDVRSIILALPCASRITADAAFERIISAAARKASSMLTVRTITICAGSAPKPASPGGYIRPVVRSCFSSATQNIRCPGKCSRSARSRAKAEAGATSSPCAANTSCRAFRINPPCSRLSTFGAPNGNKSASCEVLSFRQFPI